MPIAAHNHVTAERRPLEIDFCTTGDVPALMRLIACEWGRDHVMSLDRDLLTWQFDPGRRHGAGGEISVLVAKRGRSVVGCLGLMPFTFNVHGASHPAAWISTWLVTEAERTGSIGLELFMKARAQGFKALFVVGLNATVERLYAGLGFEIVPDMGRWVGVYDAGAAARLFDETQCPVEESAIADHMIRSGPQGEQAGGVDVVAWDEDADAAWERAWAEEISPSLISHDKSSGYITWRYIAHPAFDYQVRVARDRKTGQALGLTAYRFQVLDERPEILQRISDFIALPRGAAALAGAVTGEGRAAGAVLADLYVESAAQVRALEQCGFGRSGPVDGQNRLGFPTHFEPMEPGHVPLRAAFWLANPLRAKLGALSPRGDLYLTRADGDQDRPNRA